jgi:hypothetical protein
MIKVFLNGFEEVTTVELMMQSRTVNLDSLNYWTEEYDYGKSRDK